MKTLFSFLILACCADAQLTLKFTSERTQVPTAVIANARSLDRIAVAMCNDGAAPAAMLPERIDIAAPSLSLLTAEDAMVVLNSKAQRSFAGKLVHYLPLLGQGASLALAMASRSNASLATGISIGASVLPGVVQIAGPEVPSAGTLGSPLKYPITIPPGGCLTDYRYAPRTVKPMAPLVVKIP